MSSSIYILLQEISRRIISGDLYSFPELKRVFSGVMQIVVEEATVDLENLLFLDEYRRFKLPQAPPTRSLNQIRTPKKEATSCFSLDLPDLDLSGQKGISILPDVEKKTSDSSEYSDSDESSIVHYDRNGQLAKDSSDGSEKSDDHVASEDFGSFASGNPTDGGSSGDAEEDSEGSRGYDDRMRDLEEVEETFDATMHIEQLDASLAGTSSPGIKSMDSLLDEGDLEDLKWGKGRKEWEKNRKEVKKSLFVKPDSKYIAGDTLNALLFDLHVAVADILKESLEQKESRLKLGAGMLRDFEEKC
ncbi:hypothetical protein ADUPG1_006148 [Aduncisulcus paluster]|uniref:Uncharacterized protein n=1 Tax=Aduncisulcus paluster TaxID=2918883 RepID=A0ABQ5KK02_9EUKA|nr:hypothetical protein ADUPG1_006148 [Aduncisulcus paluster]